MAIKKQVFAAAVANGLDPRLAATWHPDLPRTPRVLVPIQVDALVVRVEGGTWADCRMRDPDPANEATIEAGALLPRPFTDLDQPRPRGVHLHWALPDGLTRGIGATPPDDATPGDPAGLGGATFPAVPDRWLVLRIGGRAGRSLSRRAVAGWVIEAGGVAPKVTPLDAWIEPGPDATRPTSEAPGGDPGNRPRKALTALGNGDPAWAAYYDNVTDRLAFHDALDGVAEGPLAYLVCGWYGDPARDVLGDAITSLAAFEARIQELGWELPAGSYGQAARAYDRIRTATLVGLETREAMAMPAMRAVLDQAGGASYDVARSLDFVGGAQAAPIGRDGKPVGGYHRIVDSWWPKYTLLHGGVVGIGWPAAGIPVAPAGLLGGGDQVGGPPPAGNVRVAIGHSMTDALAALFAANNHSPDEARVLEAALLGAADQLDEADAAARVDVRVHAASFGALPGGSDSETIQQTPPAPAPGAPQPDPGATDPGIFRDKLPKAPPAGTGGKGGHLLGTGIVNSELRANAKIAGVKVHTGLGLADMANLHRVAGTAVPPAGDPQPQAVDVKRALPRFFFPTDPVILLQGMNRSFKHGADGRFAATGLLPCRVSDTTVSELAPLSIRDLPGGGGLRGADVLDRGVANGSVPPECDDLLNELAILDPGSATFGARASARSAKRLSSDAVQRAARTYAVEQTIWWASRDPHRDLAPLAAVSGFAGTLPCAVAVSPPVRPWVPLHLDWEVEYLSSTEQDWKLGEIDFDAKAEALPPADALPAGVVLAGRALLTAGAARTAAAAVRQTMDRARQAGGSASLKPRSVEQFHSVMAQTLLTELASMPIGQAVDTRAAANASGADLRSVAEALADMDVLSGAMDRFHARLRRECAKDGAPAADAEDADLAPFVALRAGYLRIRRLRLVDCFGQVLDLAGSSAAAQADMTGIIRSEPMTVADRPDLLELAPRFTAPTRLMFRFMAADDDATEARADRSPLCGFLMPDHLDAELQFHGPDGTGIGAVRFDRDAGVQWEDAPGQPSTVGASPLRAIGNPHLAGIARGLVDWGVADATRGDPDLDTALSSLLRVIDTTLWTVDPFGHTGDEHLSLLVGHPVSVMRARLTLEIREPVAPEALQTHRVPVRIGALAQWQDGLLGYFVDDDYRTLHLPDPAAAGFARPIGPGRGFLQNPTRTSGYYDHFADDLGIAAGASPVSHDFVDPSGMIFLRPGQTVMLTLLMEPHSVVNATCGLLPRKAIGMRREWVHQGLAAIAPTFRFGPVLVDPKRIRMPLAAELNGTWSWCHRVDATTWKEDQVVNSNGDGELPRDPVEGQEGWLKLTPEKPTDGSGS
jgi:hypothetical protein